MLIITNNGEMSSSNLETRSQYARSQFNLKKSIEFQIRCMLPSELLLLSSDYTIHLLKNNDFWIHVILQFWSFLGIWSTFIINLIHRQLIKRSMLVKIPVDIKWYHHKRKFKNRDDKFFYQFEKSQVYFPC